MGGTGVVWGGAVVLYGLLGQERAGGAYGAGQVAGIIFGAVLLLAGLYYLITRDSASQIRLVAPLRSHGARPVPLLSRYAHDRR
jgi:hypothetical protein